MTRLSVILGTSLVAAAAASVAVARRAPSVAIGEPAPAFSAADTNGNSLHLSDYRGKYVVLEWSNFDCPYVRKQYSTHNMQNLQKRYTAKGVVWLTIFSSPSGEAGYYSPTKLNAMAKQKGMAATKLIADPKGALGRLYRATNTPDMFVIDPKGELIYEGAIDDDRTPDPASVKTAHNFVAAALDESMAGKPVTTPKSRPYGCGIHYEG